MAGGIYSALSGLQSKTDRLDRLASDIANVGTTGYKSERNTNAAAQRPTFSNLLDTAVDVVAAPAIPNFRAGAAAPTGRDLDLAIEGAGFFSVQTAAGVRYTRNGHFSRATDGTLTTNDGNAVLGEDGPIKLPAGKLEVASDGTISVEGVKAGRARIVTFADPSRLAREDGVRFRAPESMKPTPADAAVVRPGTLEQSNVSLPECLTQLAELTRGFEALQRGMTTLLNEIDGRAIAELGRR